MISYPKFTQPSGIVELEASSAVPSVKSAKKQVEDILQEMKKLKQLEETISKTQTDNLLNGLSYKDFPALCCAHAWLNIESQIKKLMFFFMLASLQWLGPSTSTWIQCYSIHGVNALFLL